jgi:hypothetical protein
VQVVPLGAYSLLDIMIEYSLNDLLRIVTTLLRTTDIVHFKESHEDAEPTLAKHIGSELETLSGLARKIELDSSLVLEITRLSTECASPILAIVLKTKLEYIINGLQDNLRTRRFVYLPREVAKFWDNGEILGENFLIGFPIEAVLESVDAGCCLAAGRWTASVFHLMRVAEYGLRRLARTLRVTLTDKSKPQPVEYADWDKVITACQNKINEAHKLPRTAKREKLLQHYSRAADSCQYMKDIWRNEVSHARKRYTKAEALGVLDRVREFVEPLAKIEARKELAKRKRLAELERSSQVSPGFIDFLGSHLGSKAARRRATMRDLLIPSPSAAEKVLRGHRLSQQKAASSTGKPQ